jgi:hypothetical protein
MKMRFAVSLLIGLTLTGNAGALFVAPIVVIDPRDDPPPAVPTAPIVPPRATPTAKPETVPSGNPLWGIPLRQLSATVARPLFAPSRRPPPPVVANVNRAPPASPPPKPAEPEKPQLSLVGTVATGEAGIGIFLEQGGKNVLHLKTGGNHKGWILRTVQRREVVLEKGSETAVLSLPAPDMKKGATVAPGGVVMPVAAVPASPLPPFSQPPSSSRAEPPSAVVPVFEPPAAAAPPRANPFEGLFQTMKQQVGGRPSPPPDSPR